MRAFVLALLLAPAALAQPADVAEMLDRRDVTYETEQNGDFRMLYELESGRSQLVWVSAGTYTALAVEVREVFTYAMEIDDEAPLPPGVAERLLRANHDYVQGAWSRGGGRLVFSARVPADASDDVLLSTMVLVMNTADAMEEKLTGADNW